MVSREAKCFGMYFLGNGADWADCRGGLHPPIYRWVDAIDPYNRKPEWHRPDAIRALCPFINGSMQSTPTCRSAAVLVQTRASTENSSGTVAGSVLSYAALSLRCTVVEGFVAAPSPHYKSVLSLLSS